MAIFGGSYMDDMLVGMEMDDVLWGGAGNDTLSGGAGNDRLIGGPGADTIRGGPGHDIAAYTGSNGPVHVDMGSSAFPGQTESAPVRGADAEGDVLTSIEELWGTEFGDLLGGNHADNRLFGWGGEDTLKGGGGDDYLRGGNDGDYLMGGDDNDMVFGDMGSDTVEGGPGKDMVWGGKGSDDLAGGPGNDVLEGGAGADDHDGGPGVDTAAYTKSDAGVTVNLWQDGMNPAMPVSQYPVAAGGHAEGDTFISIENLTGSMYDDMLAGNDTKTGDDPDTEMVEGADNVLVNGKNTIMGMDGNDSIKGMGDDDKLYGGAGMDTIYGGSGDDMLDGGEGDDALKGEAGSDTLKGGPGADKIFGGEFDATTMLPGPDEDDDMGDTADYSMSDAGVMISLVPDDHDKDRETPPNVMGEGGDAEGDVLVAIENLTGSAHTDMLKGDDGNNVLKGMGGDDWDNAATRAIEGGLFGEGGNDLLAGGDGMDWLDGGPGMDDLWGGAGNDMIIGGAGADFTYRAVVTEGTESDDATTAGYFDADDIDGFSAGDVVLATGDNLKTYTNAADVPEGFMRAGLYGGGGDDTLRGGADPDYIDGGSGSDTADYTGSDNGVAVDLGSEMAQVAQIEDIGGDAAADSETRADSDAIGDVLMNIENVKGSAQNDSLVGNDKANVITGGGSALTGAETTGGDEMWGLGGADTFVFAPDSSGNFQDQGAEIMDFSGREGDQIDLSAFNLSQQELINMLDEITDAGVLNLADTGVEDLTGQFTVTVVGRDLDVDDFII